MAEQKRSFTGALRNAGLRVLDRVVLGNNYDGQNWTATPAQYIGGAAATLGGALIPGAAPILRMIGNGLNGTGPMGTVLDRNNNGLFGSGGQRLPGYTIPDIDFTSGDKPATGNLGLPSSYAPAPAPVGPSMPSYTAPVPRFGHGAGGAYTRMQGMGGDGAMAFLAGRRRAGGDWKSGTHAA